MALNNVMATPKDVIDRAPSIDSETHQNVYNANKFYRKSGCDLGYSSLFEEEEIAYKKYHRKHKVLIVIYDAVGL